MFHQTILYSKLLKHLSILYMFYDATLFLKNNVRIPKKIKWRKQLYCYNDKKDKANPT